MRMMIMSWSMCFHEVLDPEMLNTSLSELLTVGNWRKLGGRPRLAEDGKLELHIPEAFSPSRPAVHFTTEPSSSSVMSHPLASTIPSLFSHSTHVLSRPRILNTPSTLTPMLAGPEAPTTFSDYTTTDRPLLSLHVITFNDAAFVTITYPHSVTDGMGRKELVENWCRVLAGRKEDVKPLADPTFDPMARIAQSEKQRYNETFLWEHKRLRGWGKLRFTLNLLWYLLTNRIRQRNLFIPAATLRTLRQSAEADTSQSPEAATRLSDSDILTAWLVRLACSHITRSSPAKPIAVSTALDLRGRLHEEDMPADVGLRLQPRGVQLDKHDGSGLTDAQIYASTKLTYNAVAESGSTNQFTEPNGFVVSVSNVSKARFHEVIDFSPAIVKTEGGGAEERMTPRGRIVWQCNTPRVRMHPPCLVYIQGKDHAGNYLAQMLVAEKTWRVIEETISKM
ncbi:uncharacterized protein GLRG_09671 [Colletotrichum graminicola M1.001]|uniref:LysR family regulatory protein n=1 Tax=Colletotrichum graminicola (strain M1.001 / M2 / FGSC 10212) TaxID=645133 RepID=E3QUI9_COLGM|nr:uncharacterized protein GLRG_09671 [Colletotrichum graminicola M1.001]EFQ34527.1 hypothetical protein GLRG_09671 [Colletotrichum graminicola M1.001]